MRPTKLTPLLSLFCLWAAQQAPWTVQCRAGTVTTYSSSPAFLSAAGAFGATSTETFETDFLRGFATALPNTATIGGVTYRTGSPYPGFLVVQGSAFGFVPTSGVNVLVNQNVIVPEELQFGGSWVGALGFALSPPTVIGNPFAADGTLTVVEVSGASTVLPFEFTAPAPQYFGFTSTSGIAQLIVTPTNDAHGAKFAFAFDDVSRSPVVGGGFPLQSIGMPPLPEPGGWVTFGLGVVGVAGMKWWRLDRRR